MNIDHFCFRESQSPNLFILGRYLLLCFNASCLRTVLIISRRTQCTEQTQNKHLFIRFAFLYSPTAFAVCLSYTPVASISVVTFQDLRSRFCSITTSLPANNTCTTIFRLSPKKSPSIEITFLLLNVRYYTSGNSK